MSQVICMRCENMHSGDNICDKCVEELKKDWMSKNVRKVGTTSDRNLPIDYSSKKTLGTTSDRNLPIDYSSKKTLGNTCASGATKNVKDIVFWGNKDTFKLISKAFSEDEGWMKSTKAMQAGSSVVIQVTTQQRNADGSYSIAEALTTVPDASIEEETKDNIVISRCIISTKAKEAIC